MLDSLDDAPSGLFSFKDRLFWRVASGSKCQVSGKVRRLQSERVEGCER